MYKEIRRVTIWGLIVVVTALIGIPYAFDNRAAVRAQASEELEDAVARFAAVDKVVSDLKTIGAPRDQFYELATYARYIRCAEANILRTKAGKAVDDRIPQFCGDKKKPQSLRYKPNTKILAEYDSLATNWLGRIPGKM